MNTRRYHGLLFASLRPPVERVALVSKIDVTAVYGNTVIPLAANEFADGTIAPRGFCHLESFRLQVSFPSGLGLSAMPEWNSVCGCVTAKIPPMCNSPG